MLSYYCTHIWNVLNYHPATIHMMMPGHPAIGKQVLVCTTLGKIISKIHSSTKVLNFPNKSMPSPISESQYCWCQPLSIHFSTRGSVEWATTSKRKSTKTHSVAWFEHGLRKILFNNSPETGCEWLVVTTHMQLLFQSSTASQACRNLYSPEEITERDITSGITGIIRSTDSLA